VLAVLSVSRLRRSCDVTVEVEMGQEAVGTIVVGRLNSQRTRRYCGDESCEGADGTSELIFVVAVTRNGIIVNWYVRIDIPAIGAIRENRIKKE
jgi:hypothetical protein